MNWLDGFIIIFLIASLMRGLEIGFVRQIFSTIGFFLGLAIGVFLNGKLLALAHAPETRAFVTLGTILTCSFALMTLGEYIGWLIKVKLKDSRFANRLDRGFGLVLGGTTLLLTMWIGAAMFRNLPNPFVQQEIRTSRVVYFLESTLPPVPDVLAKLGHLLDPNSIPQVFTGLEPAPKQDAPLPDMGELNAAVQTARASVVKIQGKGCGGIVEGSGFVAADKHVITNAHVVAGVKEPFVLDSGGNHAAQVVLFNPNLDLAVLRVGKPLAGAPLALTEGLVEPGTPGAVMGYPGGEGFTAGPAAVLETFTARGRNIYNQGETDREVYSLKAEVYEGNSGGPVIGKDGAVLGVIFATSTSYAQIGYALTSPQAAAELQEAVTSTTTKSTGSCSA